MIIIVVLLLVAVIFLPYIKRAVERVIFLNRVKKLCAIGKYKLKIQRPISALFKNFSDKYDFTVDTGKTLYAVKMWDELYKNSSAVFHSDRSVTNRRKIPETFGDGKKRTHKISERPLGSFVGLKPPSAEGRRLICVLTVHPKGAKLLYSDGGEVRAVHSRDRMYGMVCVSRGELLGVLKR